MEYKRRIRCVLGSRISAKMKAARRFSMLRKPSTPRWAPKKTTSKLLSRMNKRLLLASLILIFASSGLVIIVGSQLAPAIIGSRGDLRVYGVGVYKNANCSIIVNSLDWGTLEPGSLKNITLCIRNEGNHAAALYLETNDWSPINASSCMALSWNYSGKTLNPMENVWVILTLSVSSAAKNIVDFSFNVVIGTS